MMAVDERIIIYYYGVSYDAGILGIISYVSFCSVILLVACEYETVVKFNSSSTITLNSRETYQFESDNDLTRRITIALNLCLCLVDLIVLMFLEI